MIDVTQPPYNAQGDGVTDDSVAIQGALNDSDPTVLFPAGRAFRCAQLLVPSGKTLLASGAVLTTPNIGALGRSWILATVPDSALFRMVGGKMVGQSINPIPGGGFFIGLRLDSVIGARIEETEGEGFAFDCAHVGGNNLSRNVVFERCSFRGSGRNNISIVNASNVLIADCALTDVMGNNPGAGIDIEPNLNERCDNITVIRCWITGCSVGIYDQQGQGLPGLHHSHIDNVISGSRRIGIVVNSCNDVAVIGNELDGPSLFPGPPQFLTVGISLGGFNEVTRTSNFTVRQNKVRGFSRHIVLAGVKDGEVVSNDSRKPEYPGLGIDGRMLIADNFIRS